MNREHADTELEYLKARYYNANQGRFFQEDTYLGDITDPLTLNRYAYTKNSPMNYVDPSGHVSSYLTGDAPEWTSGNQVPVPAAGQYIPNTTNYGSTLTDNGGALLGEVLGGLAVGVVLTLGAPVSLPIAAFLIAVGSATGMVVGGTAQKNHQTKLTQKQINEIDKLLNQYEDELKTLAQGGEISEKKFNKLQQDMEDLVENKLQLCGDLEDLQEDMEGYEALGKITVMVAGTAMTLGELLGIGSVSNSVQLVNNGGMVSYKASSDIFNGVNENALKDTVRKHVFSAEHIKNGIMELGKSKDEILDKGFDIVKEMDLNGMIKEGPTQIKTYINGLQTEIKIFIQDGKIINFDMFKGWSLRDMGNTIYFGG